MKLLSLEPESSASANSAIPAGTWHIIDLTNGFVKRFLYGNRLFAAISGHHLETAGGI